jgi:hypothetical protein
MHTLRYLLYKRIALGFILFWGIFAAVFFVYLSGNFEYEGHWRYSKKTILDEKFDLEEAGLDEERSVITFSFLSEGLARYVSKKPESKAEATAILEKCIRLAVSEKIRHVQSLSDTATWLHNNLYLTHLGIILASYQKISGSVTYHPLHSTIAMYLAMHLQYSSSGNIRSYAQMREIWPADNAATLYSLLLYDRLNATHLHEGPARKWLNYMAKQGTDPKTDLYVSELTGCTGYSNVPRGCSLSWIVRYMSAFAPDSARIHWVRYKRQFKMPLLIACAFREYPKGVNLGVDYDTGPIIFEMGSAATGLALPAAARVRDRLTLLQLRCAMMVMDIIVRILPAGEVRQVTEGLLARSIRLNAL